MDLLKINGIRAYGYTGFFAEEKKLGQWFQANVVIEVDMLPASTSDDLNQAINYATVIQLTQSMIASAQCDLIETLGETILDRILQLPNVRCAEIQLTKETPPIPDFSGSVTVQMKRQKRPEVGESSASG